MDISSYLLGKKAGGGSGTTDYNALTNKPSINGVALSGNKTSEDLGIEVPTIPEDLLHYKGHVSSIDDLPSTGQPSAPSSEGMALFLTDAENTMKTKDTTMYDNLMRIRKTNYRYYIGGIGGGSYWTSWMINTDYSETVDGLYTWGTNASTGMYTLIHINASPSKPVCLTRETRMGNEYVKYILFVSDANNTPVVKAGSALDSGLIITEAGWFITTAEYTRYIYSNMYNHRIKFMHPITLDMYATNSSSPYYKTNTYPDVQGMIRQATNYNYALGYIWIKIKDDETIDFVTGEIEADVNDTYIVGDYNDLYVANSSYTWEHWSKQLDLTSINGYDATKTQILKNINGTIKWVDE